MTTAFSNSVVLPENLPGISTADFSPMDRKYLKLIYIQYSIFAVIVFLSGLMAFIAFGDKLPDYFPWVAAGGFLILVSYSLVITYISFPYRGYLIRERDIAYQRGLIRYKLTSIPFNRIQHVELNQGIIAKQMKLGSLKIYTAGGSSDDLVIPGLPIDIASQIREFLTGKIGSNDQY